MAQEESPGGTTLMEIDKVGEEDAAQQADDELHEIKNQKSEVIDKKGAGRTDSRAETQDGG